MCSISTSNANFTLYFLTSAGDNIDAVESVNTDDICYACRPPLGNPTVLRGVASPFCIAMNVDDPII